MKSLLTTLLLAVLLIGCANMNDILGSSSGSGSVLGQQGQLANAVKQTLELSSTRAADSLSKAGGYFDNPAMKIMMPEQFNNITSTLRQFGFGRYVDDIEKSMNKGAEQAAAKAGEMFVASIKNMEVDDAIGIIRGGNTAATDYFRAETEDQLRQEYQPIIRKNLQEVGFFDEYERLLDIYNTLPVSNKVNLDLEDYVVEQSLNGLFTRVAEEEKAIRANPLSRGSELLSSIFSATQK